MEIMEDFLKQVKNNTTMKKYLLFLFYFQTIFLLGCCKEPPIIEKPSEISTNLEIIWATPFYPDSSTSYYVNPLFSMNYLVLANESSDAQHPIQVRIFDRLTGQIHSAWRDGYRSIIEKGLLQDCMIGGNNQNIICLYTKQHLYGYSLETGQRLWKTVIPSDGISHMSISERYAFVSYAPGTIPKSLSKLISVDLETGNSTEILTLYIEDNYEFDINPPTMYINNQGDILLYFTTSGWNFTTVHGRVNMYCYNMTKKQMVWLKKDFTKDTDASEAQQPPLVIENNKLIVTSLRAIHCFDMNTGELLWQHENLAFADRPYLYHEGKLYVRSGDPCMLYCFDAQTGQKLWENTTLNPIPAPWGNMAIYKDKLYFTAWGKNAWIGLFCVDATTGEFLWQDAGPTGRVSYGVIADQEKGYLYCQSGWLVMCVDLNKTPNGKADVK